MRVLFVAGREVSYARNEVLLRAFRRFADVTVVAPDRHPVSLAAESARLAVRAAAHLAGGRFDLLFVGFYGYLILQGLRPLLRLPVLFDAFLSNYDTLALDRGAIRADSSGGRLAIWLDRSTCALADRVLVDTQAHADYFASELGVPRRMLAALPVGCNEEIFRPTEGRSGPDATVLYYCTYLPLHGVDAVLHAASYLAALPVRFRLIGDGPLRPAMEDLAGRLRLKNVAFVDSMPARLIAEEVAGAQICLGGHFGASGKAQRTIPGKVYQMLAAQRAVVAADSAANRELLRDGESALLVPSAHPGAVALAILRLHQDATLRTAIAQGGRAAYEAQASEEVITRQLRDSVTQLTGIIATQRVAAPAPDGR